MRYLAFVTALACCAFAQAAAPMTPEQMKAR
jgi:hypothetical protein